VVQLQERPTTSWHHLVLNHDSGQTVLKGGLIVKPIETLLIKFKESQVAYLLEAKT